MQSIRLCVLGSAVILFVPYVLNCHMMKVTLLHIGSESVYNDIRVTQLHFRAHSGNKLPHVTPAKKKNSVWHNKMRLGSCSGSQSQKVMDVKKRGCPAKK